ncbi:MAG: hypothetical protein U1F98_09615 [Verrucomicrobiota bacterium]
MTFVRSFAGVLLAGLFSPFLAAAGEIKLAEGWRMTCATNVAASGAVLSTAGFNAAAWFPARVPSTVLGTLVNNGVFGGDDVFVGTNYMRVPGLTNQDWWFRTEFAAPRAAQYWLKFGGIQRDAEIYLNGSSIGCGSSNAFIPIRKKVTGVIRPGTNALAVRVRPPRGELFNLIFVDWNEAPRDGGAGLWRAVTLQTTAGPVAVEAPNVAVTDIAFPNPASCTVSARALLINGGDTAVSGVLRGAITGPGATPIPFEQPVSLNGGEEKWVAATVRIPNPKLWWPYQLGTPELYELKAWFETGGVESDSKTVPFGIRKFEQYHTPDGMWGLKLNGEKVLCRGAGYNWELFSRYDHRRNEGEMGYLKMMGLNSLRFEGWNANDELYDICDREGIFIMLGQSCDWETYIVGGSNGPANPTMTAMVEWQMREFRRHPSLAIWTHGSDNEPSYPQQDANNAVLDRYGFRGDSAVAKNASLWACLDPAAWDGIKMQGEYNYMPPGYFWEGADQPFGGGAWGFCAEQGPGAILPEYESLVKFIPTEHLWPPDNVWDYHTAPYAMASPNPGLGIARKAIDERYGPSSGAEEFCQKAQLSQYESMRAQYESYSAFKSRSHRPATGVYMWMLNNALPGLFWNLFDYYLKPNSATFATQKACARPLHVSLNCADNSVWINNERRGSFSNYTVLARVYNIDLSPKYSNEVRIASIDANASRQALSIGSVPGLSTTYFVRLQLKDSAGTVVDDNVYWQSTRTDAFHFEKHNNDGCEITRYADLTGLNSLPVNDSVGVSGSKLLSNGVETVTIRLRNDSEARLAFFLRAEVTQGEGGPEVVPVFYDDNDVTLWPGESKVITARYATADLQGKSAGLRVGGFHVPRTTGVISPTPR